jgi:hypothetical protein
MKPLKMKKYILKYSLLLAILFATSNIGKAQQPLECQLSNLNLASFINKPIDSLLAKIPAGYTQLIVRGGGNMFLAGGIAVAYPSEYDIDIRAYDFQYVTQRNVNRVPSAQAWPIHLMRKEKIARIIIYKNWTVINSSGE